MKTFNKAASLFFLLGGIAIIVAVFLLFLKDIQSADMLYLNMISCCVAYVVTFVSAFDILGPVARVSKASPGYGLRWVAEWIYLPAVVVTVVLSMVMGLGFNLCLILQIVYLFVFLMMSMMSVVLAGNVNSFEDKEKVRKSGLEEIRTEITMLEVRCAMNAGGLSSRVEVLKEAVRYITASDAPAAAALEERLARQISLVAVKLESPVVDQEAVEKELDVCMSLVELRKKQY